MNRRFRTTLLLMLVVHLGALDITAQQKENVLVKAMQDELTRSMETLRLTGHDKPFFISYGVTDVKNFSAYSSLGAIIQSGSFSNRAKSVRVLVGDYAFNDESLDNNLFSDGTANEIQLPEDDDYFGIRRAFWTTTDVVYKGAAQKYKKHQATLKEQNKKLEDLPHRTFAKVPVVSLKATPSPFILNTVAWEDYCKQLSAIFRDYPELESSDVMLNITAGTHYFVSSEGSLLIKPYRVALIQCRAQIKSALGEPLAESIVHTSSVPEDLPSIDQFKKEARAMAEKLRTLQTASALEDEYSGPVLFLGQAAADVFSSTLFSFRETLVASNAILSTTDFRPEVAGALDSRIGKIIIDNTITVKARPLLKKFGNVSLLGSYEVDDEGVVPPDELVLVEKGVLKAMLNDRSLTKAGQTANGHGSGPAVIDVSVDGSATEQSLKDALISAAKKDGLEFALIVREHAGLGEGLAEIWKVDLQTRTETLLRSAQLSNLTLKDLRRIAGASKEQAAYNIPAGEGNLASFIVPKALLLSNVDVVPFKLPYLEHEEVYVQSPLKK